MAISTDYRDNTRSAFQQYAVVSDFNACKLPRGISTKMAAPLGVAFVAASIALGVCLGVEFFSFEDKSGGIDLLDRLRSLARHSIPEDIREECFDGIRVQDRAKKGDWIVIWGGEIAHCFEIFSRLLKQAPRLVDAVRFSLLNLLDCE